MQVTLDLYGVRMVEEAPRCVIVMGVSGSGKTTIAVRAAEELGWTYAEGDDFHPQANRDKMASGTPLTDEDRWPWLRTIADWIRERGAEGESTVVTCSALRRSYRELLASGNPHVQFCHVAVSPIELASRMKERKGHYMPASLLQSQLNTLEPLGEDEPGITVVAEGPPDDAYQQVLRALRESWA
jgi:gluconokinase